MPHPFHPHDASFNRDNAIYLAHASDVAYIRSPRVAAKERLGLEASAFLNRLTRTRGFLGVCETHAVLSFRGSDPLNIQTWVTDAVVKLVESSEYDGRVHHGFSSALRRTWSSGRSAPAREHAGDGSALLEHASDAVTPAASPRAPEHRVVPVHPSCAEVCGAE